MQCNLTLGGSNSKSFILLVLDHPSRSIKGCYITNLSRCAKYGGRLHFVSEVGEEELRFPAVVVNKVFVESFLRIIDFQSDMSISVCYIFGERGSRQLNDPNSDAILDAYASCDHITGISLVARKSPTGIDLKFIHAEARSSGLYIGLSARCEPDSVSWVEQISKEIEHIVTIRNWFVRLIRSEWAYGICTWTSAILAFVLAVVTLAASSQIILIGAFAGLTLLFLLLSVSLFLLQRISPGGTIFNP
jgi:hypothetical protein